MVVLQGCFLPGGPLAVSGNITPMIDAINGLEQLGDFDRVSTVAAAATLAGWYQLLVNAPDS